MTEHYLDRLARTINENWNSPALSDFYLTEDGSAQNTSRGNHYTYGEMYDEILHVCDIFQSLGLKQGDHIAICGANSAHWAIAYLAIAAYQGVAVTILHSQSPEDIAHQIDFSDAKALFTDDELWEELKDYPLPQIKHVISLEKWHILRGKEIKISNLQSPISNREASFVHDEQDSLAMICFTSGSTGVSKGVMLSHKCFSNHVYTYTNSYEKSPNRNYIVFLPLAHMAGFTCEFLPQISLGKQIYLFKDIPNINNIFASLAIIKPYMLTEVPKVIGALCDVKGCRILTELSQLLIGGSLIDPKLEKMLLTSNVCLIIGYGQTEVGALSTLSPYRQHRYSSVGKSILFTNVKIDSNGEILVKGENVMLGYYKDPEATARKIDKEGWLHTGDKGHLDEDGYLYVEGRLDQDMIVLPNGENIHPEDIERKINALPEVKESIVLARDGKLVAIVVASLIENRESGINLRRHVLRTINPELPLYSQLYDVEITDTPLAKTEKQTIKRYLYK